MANKVFKATVRSVLIGYLIALLVLPIGAIYVKGFSLGWQPFWEEVTGPLAWKSVVLTIKLSILSTIIQMVIGTMIAYVLVRYTFPGKKLLNSMVDLPFSLPTSVAGLMILTLLGPQSPLGAALEHAGIKLLYNQTAIVIGLVFVTFPFVIRTVQPLLEQIDPSEEQASYTLGASKWLTFRRIVFPAVAPGIVAGSMLAFSRALAEFGAISLISGNLPGKTMVVSVYIYGETQNFNPEGAAALSIVLLTLSLLLLWIINLVSRERRQLT
ncbi:sulfate ABC transporter permease subunit CysT [Paenibacillus athensensis]|uniref:Molybdenum transport system permease n=1 Tax=Paenibacillus athensensis TaxID=1967502 RepID=A0A4Y8PSB2_9BACL|nr:sulfate ABC transporter permease subunit CysT [Paenibacillus athensensis]MCD1257245.1 sulfate ABC transporter permease subunit CysT [Paenibacillus athensensis]